MPPRNRFGYNDSPNEFISRDTPLVLQTASEQTPVATATTVEGTGVSPTGASEWPFVQPAQTVPAEGFPKIAASPPETSEELSAGLQRKGLSNTTPPDGPAATGAFPFSHDSSSDVVNAQNATARRNMARISSGPTEVFPPPQSPSVPVSRGEAAGTSSAEATSSVIGTQTQSQRISFRENAERAEMLAQALSTTIKRQVEQLRSERHNETGWHAEIDFLEGVSATLDEIAAAIREARRATTSEDREKKFIEAETLASRLAKAGREFAERNYERVVDYGGYSTLVILGTGFFTTLFGVSAEAALATQLVLLGLSGPKK
jgi:hypothetical protein